jgi:hypothetical protein
METTIDMWVPDMETGDIWEESACRSLNRNPYVLDPEVYVLPGYVWEFSVKCGE